MTHFGRVLRYMFRDNVVEHYLFTQVRDTKHIGTCCGHRRRCRVDLRYMFSVLPLLKQPVHHFSPHTYLEPVSSVLLT